MTSLRVFGYKMCKALSSEFYFITIDVLFCIGPVERELCAKLKPNFVTFIDYILLYEWLVLHVSMLYPSIGFTQFASSAVVRVLLFSAILCHKN